MNAFATALAEAPHGLELAWDTADPREVRRQIRTGQYRGHTGALAKGFVQANLAIMPLDYAEDFLRFCSATPSPVRCWPCPSRAIPACRNSPKTSTSGPTCRATGVPGRRV